ncbi:MAG: MFS transporter [Cyanobacteriota bacterium]|nr:MFS transporter [Cyanobacteriota bacterium]
MHGVNHPTFGLWHHPNFLRLWVGESISLLGSAVTHFALPLTAALLLEATPMQMGWLGTAEFSPFLLLGLLAGVWVDRGSRRWIMVGCNVGRAVLLMGIPWLAWRDHLTMPILYAIAFGVGSLTVFFDVAYQALLPALVERDQILEGNTKLHMSWSLAEILGPSVAGWLATLFSAPYVIALDALSFLISAVLLLTIQVRETGNSQSLSQSITQAIQEGLTVVLSNPFLRSLAGCTGSMNLFDKIILSVFVLFATRDLQMNSAWLGLVMAMAALGSLLGSFLTARITRRVGLGKTITISAFVSGLGYLVLPLAHGWYGIPVLMLGWGISGFAGTVYDMNQLSLRQTLIPDRLQGRMNATVRFLIWGTMPIGFALGGWLGETIGLRSTLWVGGIGMVTTFLWPYFSPVLALQRQPDPIREAEGQLPSL